MYIFTRSLRLGPGDLRQQMAWATSVTEKVNQISEVPVLLWSAFASSQTGSLAWSASVTNMAELEALGDKLMADDGYLTLIAEGARHVQTGTLTDALAEVLHANTNLDPAHLRYVTAGTARAKPGQMAKAAEVGIRMAQKMSEVTGAPYSISAAVTGRPGTFQLASYYETIDQLEEAGRKIRTEPVLLKIFDGEASQVFADDVTDMVIVRRIL